MKIEYKGISIDTSKAKEGDLFLIIADCAKELGYKKYEVVEACAAELAHRSTGYHERMKIAELNQYIFDKMAMVGRTTNQ